MPELKPCPFCGGEDIDEYEGDYGNGVYCMSCGAMMGEQIHKHDFHYDGGRVSYEHARDAWNTRAERTCHVVPHGYCIANGEKSSCRCWSCSECSYGWHVSDYDRQYRYCPNCGARVVE